MTGDLYRLRYKHGYGVVDVFLQASSQTKANEVGQRYCDGIINSRFIKVEPAVVADETILREESKAPAHKFDERPSGTDESPTTTRRAETTRAREAVRAAAAAIPPPNPAVERARDAADEDEDRRQQLLDEEREVLEDQKARGNKADGSASSDPPKEEVKVPVKVPAMPKMGKKR